MKTKKNKKLSKLVETPTDKPKSKATLYWESPMYQKANLNMKYLLKWVVIILDTNILVYAILNRDDLCGDV